MAEARSHRNSPTHALNACSRCSGVEPPSPTRSISAADWAVPGSELTIPGSNSYAGAFPFRSFRTFSSNVCAVPLPTSSSSNKVEIFLRVRRHCATSPLSQGRMLRGPMAAQRSTAALSESTSVFVNAIPCPNSGNCSTAAPASARTFSSDSLLSSSQLEDRTHMPRRCFSASPGSGSGSSRNTQGCRSASRGRPSQSKPKSQSAPASRRRSSDVNPCQRDRTASLTAARSRAVPPAPSPLSTRWTTSTQALSVSSDRAGAGPPPHGSRGIDDDVTGIREVILAVDGKVVDTDDGQAEKVQCMLRLEGTRKRFP